MVRRRLKLWNTSDVAQALGVSTARVSACARTHNIGRKAGPGLLYNSHDVHCIAWIFENPGYHGPWPWDQPGVPVAERGKWYTIKEAAELTGYTKLHLHQIRNRTSIGAKVGYVNVFTVGDIKHLRARKRGRHPWFDTRIRDPEPMKIKIDRELLSIYTGIMEEIIVAEKTYKTTGRKANFVSCYPTDEQVEWLQKRLKRYPWMKKSQIIVELIQKAMEQEARDE